MAEAQPANHAKHPNYKGILRSVMRRERVLRVLAGRARRILNRELRLDHTLAADLNKGINALKTDNHNKDPDASRKAKAVLQVIKKDFDSIRNAHSRAERIEEREHNKLMQARNQLAEIHGALEQDRAAAQAHQNDPSARSEAKRLAGVIGYIEHIQRLDNNLFIRFTEHATKLNAAYDDLFRLHEEVKKKSETENVPELIDLLARALATAKHIMTLENVVIADENEMRRLSGLARRQGSGASHDASKPSPEQTIGALNHMDELQVKLSEVRALYLKRAPGIAHLPRDLKVLSRVSRYAPQPYSDTIEGTFHDGRVVLERRRLSSDEKSGLFSGTRNGQPLSEEEAKQRFQAIYPTAEA
jgi:hypothetical protein